MNILVIGGTKGLGKGLVEELQKRGHKVTAMSRTTDPPLNLEWNETQIAQALLKEIKNLNSLDVLIVSSGMGAMFGPLASTDELKKLMQVNCFGPIACYKAALKALLKSQGKVMFVGSTVSRRPGAGSLAYYAASKGAINSWMLSEARRAARKKISLFVLQPGWFESPMTDEIKEEEKEKSRKAIPFKEFGSIEEIAKFGSDLVEQSNWVTSGSIFECSGGA